MIFKLAYTKKFAIYSLPVLFEVVIFILAKHNLENIIKTSSNLYTRIEEDTYDR